MRASKKIVGSSSDIQKESLSPESASNVGVPDTTTLPKKMYVRVLLADTKVEESFSWSLHSSQGFLVRNADYDAERMSAQLTTLTLTCQENSLCINGKKVRGKKITIQPRANHCIFQESMYEGTLIFILDDQKAYLINVIDLEAYVYAVLRWEGWPGWPLEVNKVFAIMCRSYVVAKVLEARSKEKKALYDIRNTNIHQTYKGTHSSMNIWEAVKETEGIILSYQKKPIVAMYDSCCGGVIPARISEVNFYHAPYLERSYACTFCRDCKIYQWRTVYPLIDFHQRLQGELELDGTIKAVKVGEKDRAGLVREIKIRVNKTWHSLTGKKLYKICKEIKSLSFSVRLMNDEVIFTGVGYGHQLGLCQWGARQMVKDGWTYKKVLTFYYPGTQFMKVEVA